MSQDFTSAADVPLDDLPVVDVPRQWFKICEHLAHARALTYADYDRSESWGDQSFYQNQLTGVLGEIAAQLAVDGTVNESIHALGDGGYDFEHDGYQYNVRTTATTAVDLPSLLVSRNESITCDRYLQCHRVAPSAIRIVGWVEADRVTERKPKQFPGTRWNYVVEPDDLHAP